MINDKRKLRIGILWADPYCGNLGVAALAYSTLILFEKAALRTGLQFDYTLWGASCRGRDTIDAGTQRIAVRTVRSFMGGDWPAFLRNCLERPVRIGTPLFALDFLQYDWVADMGAGDSYSDIYGITRFRNMDFTKSWARRLHKRYILLPQTLGPFSCEEARTKAARSMAGADGVFARDRMSFDCARELAPDAAIECTIDTAFFLPYARKVFGGDKIKVGVNVSGLLWHGGYTQDNQFGLRSDYRRTVLAVLDGLSAREDVELHLIAHVIGDPRFVDEDTHVIGKLAEQYPRAVVSPAFRTPVEAKSYIAGMDFFTGARMHACIAAISSGVPVYPMAYSRKFNGLFGETLGYSSLGDLKTMDSDEIFSGLFAAFEKRNELKNEIEQICRRIVEPEKEKMIDKLSEYIERHA